MRTRARLGQHFLNDDDSKKSIVRALCVLPSDLLIEIGPGHGELTKLLASSYPANRIIAIEKDPVLASHTAKQLNFTLLPGVNNPFSDISQNIMLNADVRRVLPSLTASLVQKDALLHYKIIGNIPYYLTAYLLRVISELAVKPVLVVLTVQKEVAERIVAESPRMNLLAASIQVWAKSKIINVLSRSLFHPAPQVDSAVLVLELNDQSIDLVRYYKLIKQVFNHPRKTLKNNLKTYNSELVVKALNELQLPESVRPSELSINQLKALTDIMYNNK